MSTESASPTDYGLGGSTNWLLGGAIGGIVGSLLFGALLWVFEPTIVTDTVPGIYGVDSGSATIGWLFHLLHGLVLGVVFGAIVSREVILGTLTATTQFDVLEESGLAVRFVLAGAVYGLAIWAVLPVIGGQVLITVGTDPGFPAIAAESLAGHLLYGALLGALFSVFVEAEPDAETPFDDADRDR
jgi:hypothetical protein